MENRTREVGEFVITEFEREITDSQLKGIEADNVMDAENIAYLTEHRMIEYLRIEHRSGIWTIELPVYSLLYHAIMALSDEEKDVIALGNMLMLVMENSTIIGDEEYILACADAKRKLQERELNGINK